MFSRVGFWFGPGFNVKLERMSDTWTVFSFITCWLIDSDCGRISVLESRHAGELLPICSAPKRLQGGLPGLRHHHWLTTVFNTLCVVCIYVSHSSWFAHSNHNNIYILFLLNVDNLICDSALTVANRPSFNTKCSKSINQCRFVLTSAYLSLLYFLF